MPQEPWEKYAADKTAAPASGAEPWERYGPSASEFAAPSNNKEGLYEMKGADGKVQKVPYSKVDEAFKTGLRFDNPAGFRQYTKDKEADGPSALSDFAESEYGALGNAAKGMAQVANWNPSEEEQKVAEQSGPVGRAYDTVMRYPERLVKPNVDMAVQAGKDVNEGNYAQATGHAIGAVIPVVGPWMQQTAQQIMEQLGAGNYAGAAGTAVGNVMAAEAPKVIGKAIVGTAKAVPNAVRGTAEALTKTSPSELRRVAEETQKTNQAAAAKAAEDNAKNTQTHLENTQEALHKTQGAELTTDAANKAAVAKAAADHAKATADTHAHNQRVSAKHAAEVEKITKDNAEAEQAIQERKGEEEKLQQATSDYYAKEDAVKGKAKAEENAAWKPWRDKIKGVEVDADPLVETVEKFGVNSPEIRRMMLQLIPPPEDAPITSQFYKDRQSLIDQQGFNSPDLQYDKLNPNQRDIIDNLVNRLGLEPDPIDLDLKKGEKVSLENIHRAKSIIGRNIASGRYEGSVLGEMRQVAKALDRAEKLGSNSVGALDDLQKAKEATIKYQEAFGRVRHLPVTQDELFKKQANPEQFKEENDQERLDAASKHDPSLAEDYEKVKAQREKVKKMKTEDQLRKSQKEHPPAPTVDDLREGYRLKPLPEATPAEQRLPERTAPPDRPVQVVPERKTITPEDIRKDRAENIQKFANRLREMGVRRALYAAGTVSALGLSGVVAAVFSGHAGGAAAADVAGGASSGGLVLAGSHALANLLEKPEVVDWISKIDAKDVAAWEKLPPDQKALFTQDMKALADTAEAKKIHISPYLSSFVAGSSASQPKTPEQIKKEAEERQRAQGPISEVINSPLFPGVQHALRAMDEFSKSGATS